MCFDPPRVEILVKIDPWTCTMSHIMTKGYKKQLGLNIGGGIGGCKNVGHFDKTLEDVQPKVTINMSAHNYNIKME